MTSRNLTVAIFGATSGIAVAIARIYAESGARLVLVGRDSAAVDAMAADLNVRGAGDIRLLQADLGNAAQLPEVAELAWNALGGCDVAIVAYGVMLPQEQAEQQPEAAETMLRLNFVSPAVLIGLLANRFEAQGRGTLAVITSVAGDRGRDSNYVYGAAKGGLQRMLEGLHQRLASKNVRVVDIRPGFVSTRMTEGLDRRGPLWAQPDDVAQDIVRAVDRGSPVCYTPWFWRLIMMILTAMPRFIFYKLPLSAKASS
jgi:decaprenylphospho-beta-D-erythro-pentofuranosid-2-ulose 2-reductase